MQRHSASTLAGVLLLALDTATPAVTVALHDGDDVIAEHTAVDPRRHGELLAPGIERVLRSANATPRDITDIAVGVGPGPFTGLRVGIVTARTLGEAVDASVRGYCTLDVLAWQAKRATTSWSRPMLDGVRSTGRVTAARSDWMVHTSTSRPRSGGPARWWDAVVSSTRKAFSRGGDPIDPSAAALARLAVSGVPALPPEPLYLRRPDAVEPAASKSVMAR